MGGKGVFRRRKFSLDLLAGVAWEFREGLLPKLIIFLGQRGGQHVSVTKGFFVKMMPFLARIILNP